MNEVSCRAVECFAPALEAHGHSLEEVLAGLPVAIEHLMDPTQRMDWEVNVAILRRTAALLGRERLEELGSRALHSRPFHLFRLVAVVVADSRFLYRMTVRWAGPMLFSHLRFGYDELRGGRIRLRMEIPEEYAGCPELFECYAGAFRALPRLLGYGDAEVEAEISPHLGVFTIRAPRRASLTGWLRSLVRLPRAARAAADARAAVEYVASEQRQLNRTIQEMREAHAELRSQVEYMATLDRLGRALSRQLSSEQIPDRILEFLNERFGWRGSSLSVQTGDASGLLFFGKAGSTDGPSSLRHPLLEGGRELGVLEVWRNGEPETTESRQQLEKLLPWIAMTVVNARLAAGRAGNGLRWASKTGHDLFLILDSSTRILYAGPRVDEVLGYETEELQQLSVAELVHPDDAKRLAGEIGELSAHSSSAFYSRARLRMQGGDFCNMEGVAIKVLSEAGATVYLVSCSVEGAAEHGPAH